MGYHANDREQIEELKQWWNDYGKAITIAVIIGLLIGFGWRYWNRYNTNRESAASQIYMQTLQAASTKQLGVAEQYTKQLKNQYSSTPYATLGALMQAKLDVGQNKYPAAINSLKWVVDHGKTASFKEIARIREARILVQQKRYQQARDVLSVVNDKSFAPAVEMVKKTIDKAQGVTTKATV